MDICLYNIQGFRGEYHYSIDDLITIINSKHNGVGKTTLYDCIRFLCDASQVDKEEREFFLNLNENEGLFSITRNGVTHGFILWSNRPPVFYRQVEGEEIERSDDNFPTAAQDIGILNINGALLNIFSKEVNLFSGSNTAKNYQLVEEVSTHKPTEEMLDLMERSININQTELSNLRAEKKGIDLQVETMPYYLYVDQLEKLLSDDFYEDMETFLIGVQDSLDKLQEVEELNFNSKFEQLLKVEESLHLIQPSAFDVPNPKPLEFVEDLFEILNRIQIEDEPSVYLNTLERIVLIDESLSNLAASDYFLDINTTLLEKVDALSNQLDALLPVHQLDVSVHTMNKLADVCIKLGQMGTTLNQENRFNRLAEEKRKTLANTRVQCPIREEVYLINGQCVY